MGDDEQLYRRVPCDPTFFSVANGKLRLSTAAFNDPAKKPSVDRASLRNNDPHSSKTDDSQGIVGLLTADVRRIGSVTKTDKKGATVGVHAVDVTPDPLDHNPSHALVVVEPQFESNRPFERLKESLARLAERGGWLVRPMVKGP